MVVNLQTLGTVFVGVLTSAATWFMFGKSLLNTGDAQEEMMLMLQDLPYTHEQPRRIGGVPETMYPKQVDLYYFRTLPREKEEGDAVVLVSASWLPAHQKELARMREMIQVFWQRGLGRVKVAYIPFESLLREDPKVSLTSLPTILIIKDGQVVGRARSTKSLLSDYRRLHLKVIQSKPTVNLLNFIRLNSYLHSRSTFYFLLKQLVLNEMRLVENARKNMKKFYIKAVFGMTVLVVSLRLIRTRPQLVFGWIKRGVSLFPSPFASQ